MPALSAPSAKILMLSSSIFFIFTLALYDCQRIMRRKNPVVVIGRRRFFVCAIDEDGAATRSDAGLDITIAVSDHITPLQVDFEFGSTGQQHSRLRFAAVAAVIAVMEADDEPFERGHFARK